VLTMASSSAPLKLRLWPRKQDQLCEMQRMVWCVQTRKSQNAPSMVLVISIHILADSLQTVSLVQASH